MKEIRGRNVNEIYAAGVSFMIENGWEQSSQYDATLGKTLEIPEPVGVMYERPLERVLYDPVRDSNPFLGFFEALWIIAGRRDVKFLADIVSNMRSFSDDGATYHGAYGYRLRNLLPGEEDFCDQIEEAIRRLSLNPDDRQVVMLIRRPDDMWYKGKDQPCNYAVDLKIRQGRLNMSVINRSNDFVWGMTGTNVVQFSTLQEYIAGRIGVDVGTYHQITTSMHVYQNQQWDKIRYSPLGVDDPYAKGHVEPYPMFKELNFQNWHSDLKNFFSAYDNGVGFVESSTPYFKHVVWPMWRTLQLWKKYQKDRTIANFCNIVNAKNDIHATDWKLAAEQWLNRRERA